MGIKKCAQKNNTTNKIAALEQTTLLALFNEHEINEKGHYQRTIQSVFNYKKWAWQSIDKALYVDNIALKNTPTLTSRRVKN